MEEIITFKDNIKRLPKIVGEIFKSDKGMLSKEEVALIKLYNKSFSIWSKLDKLTKEMEDMDKNMEIWK